MPLKHVPAAREHSARTRQVIEASVHLGPPGGHGSGGGSQVVPGSTVVEPAGEHGARTRQVVPGTTHVLPSGKHEARTVEEVPRTVYLSPAARNVARAIMVLPLAIDLLPPGSNGQTVELGYAARVSLADARQHRIAAQEHDITCIGNEGMLDNDAEHAGHARMVDDAIVVRGRPVGIATARLGIANLRPAAGQAHRRQLREDAAGKPLALGVEPLVEGGVVGMVDFGAAHGHASAVDVEAHEDVGIGAKGAVNALRERRALVLGAREHHTGVIGPLELGLAGQGNLPVQILLLEAIAKRARIATAMTRIERDGEDSINVALGVAPASALPLPRSVARTDRGGLVADARRGHGDNPSTRILGLGALARPCGRRRSS